MVRLPQWAETLPSRRRWTRGWFTRRRLALAGVLVILLGFIAWLNYPFLPDPIIILFNKPTTSITSDSLPGQWSMAGKDLQLTRYIPQSSRQPVGRVLWSRHLGEVTRSAPTVVDGVVYVGAHFRVIALDGETGNVVWEQATTGPLNHQMAAARDNLYMGLLDHRLLALDRRSGEVRWEFRTQGPITSSPVVANGMAYIGSSDGYIYAVDAATGKLIWKHTIAGEVRSSPAISRGSLFVDDDEGNLYILNARTGQARLQFRTGGTATAAPVAANGLVYFPSGGKLYSVDADARELPGEFQFKQVWAQFWIWQVPGVPQPTVQKGGKWRFSPEVQASQGIIAAPAATPDALYVGDTDGNFYAVDALKGLELWRFRADDGITAPAVVVGERVYFGDTGGAFYALDRSTGELAWQLSLGAPVEVSPAFAGGRFYLRTSDGQLHAIE